MHEDITDKLDEDWEKETERGGGGRGRGKGGGRESHLQVVGTKAQVVLERKGGREGERKEERKEDR